MVSESRQLRKTCDPVQKRQSRSWTGPSYSRGYWACLGVLCATALGATVSCSGKSSTLGADASIGNGDASGEVDAETARRKIQKITDDILSPVITSSAASDFNKCIAAIAVVVTPQASIVSGYGATHADGNQIPSADTLFQIGSISKVFTGLALARSVSANSFPADTPVSQLLDSDLATVVPGSRPTLEALASHHSGLPSMPLNLTDRNADGVPDPQDDPKSPAKGYTRADFSHFLSTWVAPQSASYRYSNAAIGLLALALEDHLGLNDFDSLIHQRITDDLGMTDTWGNIANIPAASMARVIQGYTAERMRRVPTGLGEMGVLAGAGEITTTGSDMLRFLKALTGVSSTPLDATIALAVDRLNSLDESSDIGYAIEIENRADGKVYRKGGSTKSFSAYLIFARSPSPRGVILLTSCGGFTRNANTLATSIFDALVDPAL